MFSAQRLVLWIKDSRIDSRSNYSHAAASFDYWAPPGDFGQPVAVRDQACSASRIRPQFPGVRSVRQKPVHRPSQNWTWLVRLCLVAVTIASAIKKAASGHVPHIVRADYHANARWQG